MRSGCIPFILIAFLFSSCDNIVCEPDVNGWINEAPQAFEEFMLVKEEIISNIKFQREFSYDQGSMFLRELDTTGYFSHTMPRLREWFRKGRSYIAIEKGDTSFCYRKFECGSHTANGYVYYQKKERKYKSTVEITDSLTLGDWIAHVTKCDGCND